MRIAGANETNYVIYIISIIIAKLIRVIADVENSRTGEGREQVDGGGGEARVPSN